MVHFSSNPGTLSKDGVFCDRLDEIVIRREFNVAQALSSIQFYWNLARQRGQELVVEIWQAKPKPEEHGG